MQLFALCMLQLHCKCHTLSVAASLQMPHSLCCSSIANATLCLLQLHCKCHTLSVAAFLQMSHSVSCSSIANAKVGISSSISNITMSVAAVCTLYVARSIANVTLCLMQLFALCMLQLHCKYHTLSVAAPLQISHSV